MYKAIFFDLDDTIFSYDRCGQNALKGTLQVCGVPYSDQAYAFFRQVDETLWSQQKAGMLSIEQVISARAEEMARWFQRPEKRGLFQTTFPLRLAEEVEMEPFAREVLSALSKHVKLYAASNGLQEVQRLRLEKAGLLSCFTGLFVSDAMGAEKPDPRFFFACLKHCHLPAREVLMVGDSLQADMAGSHAAGLDCCWYNPKGLPRSSDCPITYEISDLRQVSQLLQGKPEHQDRIQPGRGRRLAADDHIL